MKPPAAPSQETVDLAFEIADAAARIDVASLLPRVIDDHGPWYDTRAEPVETDVSRRALAYLDRRGLLLRHPARPHLVRVRIVL